MLVKCKNYYLTSELRVAKQEQSGNLPVREHYSELKLSFGFHLQLTFRVTLELAYIFTFSFDTTMSSYASLHVKDLC